MNLGFLLHDTPCVSVYEQKFLKRRNALLQGQVPHRESPQQRPTWDNVTTQPKASWFPEFSRPNVDFTKPRFYQGLHAVGSPSTWYKAEDGGEKGIYIDDIWFSIFLWAKFEAWDLQNAAQNLSVVAQEPPFLVLLNRSGIAGIFLRPKEGLTERLCCHRVSQRGVLWQIHNISVAALPVISWYFMIFPDLPTALSDSLHTATLCALRGRLRAMEDLDDIFFEDKVGPGCCT